MAKIAEVIGLEDYRGSINRPQFINHPRSSLRPKIERPTPSMEITIPWEGVITVSDKPQDQVMAAQSIFERPLTIGMTLGVCVAMLAVAGWGFLLLHGDLSEIRHDAKSDIQSLTSQSHNDLVDTNKEINGLSDQIATTNAKLDDLIALVHENKQK